MGTTGQDSSCGKYGAIKIMSTIDILFSSSVTVLSDSDRNTIFSISPLAAAAKLNTELSSRAHAILMYTSDTSTYSYAERWCAWKGPDALNALHITLYGFFYIKTIWDCWEELALVMASQWKVEEQGCWGLMLTWHSLLIIQSAECWL